MLPIDDATLQRIRQLLAPDFREAARSGPSATLIAIPIGGLIDYAGTANPDSGVWLPTDGASLAVAGTYAALFAAIGYTHGGAGANFNVPDTRQRVTANAGGAHAAGSSGGADTHTLLDVELPPHAHAYTEPIYTTIFVPSGAFYGVPVPSPGSATTNGPGTSTPFDVRQPTIYVTKWIRYQ